MRLVLVVLLLLIPRVSAADPLFTFSFHEVGSFLFLDEEDHDAEWEAREHRPGVHLERRNPHDPSSVEVATAFPISSVEESTADSRWFLRRSGACRGGCRMRNTTVLACVVVAAVALTGEPAAAQISHQGQDISDHVVLRAGSLNQPPIFRCTFFARS